MTVEAAPKIRPPTRKAALQMTENELERFRQEVPQMTDSELHPFEKDIFQAARKDLLQLQRLHWRWMGQDPENLAQSGLYGRVFEILAKHDPLIPHNQENVQRLEDFLAILMALRKGWAREIFRFKSVPDRVLMKYNLGTREVTVTGLEEVKLRPRLLKTEKSRKFQRNPLQLLETPLRELSEVLSQSRGFYFDPPIFGIVIPEEVDLYLVVPRGKGTTGTVYLNRWKIVESVFPLPHVHEITHQLFSNRRKHR